MIETMTQEEFERLKEPEKDIRVRIKRKWEKAKEKAKDFGQFVKENPQVVPMILSGFGMLVGGGVRLIAGSGKNNESCMIKDDVTGCEFKTKHPLTNDEILELGDRMIDGEWKGQALQEMGVLKKERRRKK